MKTGRVTPGQDVATAVRDLLDRLDAELHHPDLPPRLSGLVVRGVSFATGWSLARWREEVDGWCATADDPAALRADADTWTKRLDKLRSFLATAGRESRHISADTTIDKATDRPGVEAGDLTKRYGDVLAVDGVSLTVPRGQIFGLLGPNSAGKTTFIECVEGIRTPDSGSVRVLGLSHRDDAREIKTRIGVQLQKPGFYDLLTLRETLQLYASFYPRPVDIDDLMDRLEIRDRAKTLVRDMSGGILQRMSLGVALVNDPEVVFLDEPTTGLDPQARHAIWRIVRALRDERRTVVLTTHYMDEAEQLCDRVAVMTAGRIRAQGTPQDLIDRHVGDTVVDIAVTDDLDTAAILALPTVCGCLRQGERLVLRADDPATLLTAILALPGRPPEARIRRGTLEDVFLAIAGQEEQQA